MKVLKSLFLSLVLVGVLCGCTNETQFEGEEFLPIIQKAAEDLAGTETGYIIATTIESPSDSIRYIECVKDGASYTEYSVDSDGNFGTLEYGSSESMSYALNDWLDSNGRYYIFTDDEFGQDITYYVDDYGKIIGDRAVLFTNKILEGALSIERGSDMLIDLGDGEATYTVYRVKVSSDVITSVLGAPSRGMYQLLKDQSENNPNMSKLMGYYIEDLDMSLTFSDAVVTFGIDKNGCLRYNVIEVGGLGSRMYVTKAVVEMDNQNLRETPDFTGAVPFIDTFVDLADYVASFESYDSALNALYGE